MRRATIYRGLVEDVLPNLPAGSFDAVLCDPPYGLSDDTPESIANRVRRILLQIMLPDFDQLEPGLSQQIDLSGIPLDGSRLTRAKLARIVEPRVRMPKSAVHFDGSRVVGEHEIQAGDVAAALATKTELPMEGDPEAGEFLGDYIFDARNTVDLAVHDLAGGGVAQLGLGCIAVPVVSAILPGRDCPLSRFLASHSPRRSDAVRPRAGAGRDPGPPAGVMARLGTVRGAVLRFDLANCSCHLDVAPSTINSGKWARHAERPQLVRANLGTGSLAAVAEADGVRVIVDGADGATAHFRLVVARDLLAHLEAILPPGGFMGLSWDHAVPPAEIWAEVLRACKPGAPLLAFGGTRTFHRLACAIEDAGWEIRDSVGVAWCHGQGFPKSLNIGKAIDSAAGAERPIVSTEVRSDHRGGNFHAAANQPKMLYTRTGPASSESAAFDGYGTALKPSWEPVVLAMAPLSGTFAENALEHGVAGLNIEGCRIGASKAVPASASTRAYGNGFGFAPNGERSGAKGMDPGVGRWPANAIFVHDPDCGEERCAPGCSVAELERQSGDLQSGYLPAGTQREGRGWGDGLGCEVRNEFPANAGPASRFFYCAKVAPGERGGSRHPTLKPVDLTAYLAKLLLPPVRRSEPRRILVPFSGAGSEMLGALRVGWEEVVGIEIDPQSVDDAERRVRADAPLLNQVQVVNRAAEPIAAGEVR